MSINLSRYLHNADWIFRITLFVFIVFIVTASRLAFKDTNVFFFDGDEAIVALMGLDVLDGEFPIYFYGQNYGMSILEAILIAGGVKIWGTSMLAIKIPMMCLFICITFLIGVCFEKLLGNNKWWTFLFIGMLVLSPTWLVWSMKARGGYLPSFLVSTLIILFLISRKEAVKRLDWILIGMLTVVLFEFQPLWVPGTLPPILYSFYRGKRFDNGLFYFAGILITFSVFFVIKENTEIVLAPPSVNLEGWLKALINLPSLLLNNLRGNYYLDESYDLTHNSFAYSYLTALGLILIYYLTKLFSERKLNWQFVFLTSLILSLSGAFIPGILNASAPRYLLPFYSFSLFFLASVFSEISYLRSFYVFVFLCLGSILFGLFYLPKFKNYSINNVTMTREIPVANDYSVFQQLINVCYAQNIKFVLCNNQFLQYQINYMSNRKIIAVGHFKNCRTPWNIEPVLKAANDQSDKFALVAYNWDNKFSNSDELIDGKIWFMPKPKKLILNGVIQNLNKNID